METVQAYVRKLSRLRIHLTTIRQVHGISVQKPTGTQETLPGAVITSANFALDLLMASNYLDC